ncbi:hypothetical protein H9P43_004891 [Blastocladiella emersonii ATCC 22665]|nr:hypothetical protein H9P43_004891 [Blastocladiella emersonii ATCC 22665]
MALPRIARATALLALAAVLLAATATERAAALPQLPIPTNLPGPIASVLPGGGATNQQPTTSARPSSTTASQASSRTASGTAAPTATPTATDPCKAGRCKVSERGDNECLVLEVSNVCRGFTGQYLPINLRPYFDARFPSKNPDKIPAALANSTELDAVYAGANYSYMSLYAKDYMLATAGCTMPSQLWYKTWFCIDILKFFTDRNDPCAKGPKTPLVCGTTLDSRANSLQLDLENSNMCPVGEPGRAISNKHIAELKAHPWRANNGTCISGELNEMADGINLCGYTDELTACKQKCSNLSKDRCSTLLAASSAPTTETTPTCDGNERVPCKQGMKPGFIVLIVIGIACVIGLAALKFTRRKAKDIEPINDMTIARPVRTEQQPLVSHGPSAPAPAMTAGVVGAAAMGGAGRVGAGAVPAPVNPLDPALQPTECTVAQVLQAFAPTKMEEIELAHGDWVTVHIRYTDQWAQGTRHAQPGRPAITGYFPVMCVESAQSHPTPPRFDSLQR